ncbi:MAG: ATP-grasp domain-containing protein [Methanobrevibacter sp.]|nr:ATP-grasp domain-containing protein [Candidatus Methanovirga aequatorialis]
MENKICVVVDGYSTGSYYVNYFIKEDFDCFHIQSQSDLPLATTFCHESSGFKSNIVNESVEKTVEWIKEKGVPEFIVPGSESGVELADTLSQIFNTKSKNEKAKANARIDKFGMYKALKENGIRTIRQEYCKSYEQAVETINDLDLNYPAVVKPAQSCMGDGFRLCNSLIDVKKAFDDNLNSKNILNNYNEGLILQEFIKGTEYVVDTVSNNGNHVLTDLMKYTKKITEQGYSIYQAADFLARGANEIVTTVDYAFSVLDAVGIKYGAAHIEIMEDENGPVLIEIGARPAGCMLNPEFVTNAYGHNQIKMSVLSYISTEKFLKKASELNTTLNKYSSLVFLIPHESGYLSNVNLDVLEKLHSVVKVDLQVQIGEFVQEPKNLSESLAYIYLQDDDIKEIEKTKKFVLEYPEKIITISQDIPNNCCTPKNQPTTCCNK